MDLLCSRLCIRSDIDMSLSFKSYEELERASERWADWHKKVIVLDEGRKATYSKLFLKYKLDTKTVIEAEHKARTDVEYKEVVEQYANAEEELIKARYHYNNLDKYVSLKQSELKRDLALNSKV
jgi:hypothetical protein|tara:strand:+ start:587 stop:958 length:372 start_codon:yes stop_codon:yes gene_type:complete